MQNQQNPMLALMAGEFFAAGVGQEETFGGSRHKDPFSAAVWRKFNAALTEVARQRRIDETQRHLELLDDRLLRDIGITRRQIPQAVSEGRRCLDVEEDSKSAHAQSGAKIAEGRRSSQHRPDLRCDGEIDAWARHASVSNGFG